MEFQISQMEGLLNGNTLQNDTPMKWHPIDIVILILTASICLMLIITIIGASIRGEPLTPEGLKLMEKLTIAIIAIISFYVGNQTKKL